jgi:hypothetical protein
MKAQSFKLTTLVRLCLITVLCLVAICFATRIISAEVSGPLIGSASVTKPDAQVIAHASLNVSNAADDGWFWIHVQILPDTNPKYKDQESYEFDGYVQETVTVKRGGVPITNGYAYCSAWCTSSSGYDNILIDVQGE